MCQEIILQWLKEQRKNNQFYSINEIAKGVNLQGISTARKVNKLFAFDFLEIRIDSYIPLKRKFRFKNGRL